MDASKITELLQKQNTKYINRCKTVDSSTLIWKNQIQSSKYIKGVKTCDGEQNWNVPTNPGCPVNPTNGINSFGGSGRTTSIQTGSTNQVLSVYSGAEGSASRIYSSESILLQKAGNASCASTDDTYVVLPLCDCTNTNGPNANDPNNQTIPVNNQSNPYLPQFDTYYAMKTPCVPVKDQNAKHFVEECHTPFLDDNGPNPMNHSKMDFDPITKQFQNNRNQPSGCI